MGFRFQKKNIGWYILIAKMIYLVLGVFLMGSMMPSFELNYYRVKMWISGQASHMGDLLATQEKEALYYLIDTVDSVVGLVAFAIVVILYIKFAFEMIARANGEYKPSKID